MRLFSNVNAHCILDFTKESGFYQAIWITNQANVSFLHKSSCLLFGWAHICCYLLLFLIVYCIGFNSYWHRIAYFVLTVSLIYSLTHSIMRQLLSSFFTFTTSTTLVSEFITIHLASYHDARERSRVHCQQHSPSTQQTAIKNSSYHDLQQPKSLSITWQQT